MPFVHVVEWRSQFQLKVLNWLLFWALTTLVVAGFVPVFAIMDINSWSGPEFLAALKAHDNISPMAIAVAIYLVGGVPFLIVLDNDLIKGNFFCPHCGKHVSSSLHWVCGYCGCVHESGKVRHSVLYKCRQCKQPPRALVCPYPACGEMIFFDRDEDAKHAAMVPAAPLPGETHEETRARRRREREILEDSTLMTAAQTKLLELEFNRILQERRVQALKDQKEAKPLDPVEQLKQHLEDAVGAMVRRVTTQKQLRDLIGVQRAKLEVTPEFIGLSESEQRRARENFDAIADHFEQVVRQTVK